MPAVHMSAPIWRAAIWRVMDHSIAVRPRGLAWARLGAPHAVHELEGVDQVLRHRHGPPVASAALERRDPELGRGEVDVARAKGEELAHPASGDRERAGERLHRGLGVGANRGEEAGPLLGGEVLPPAGVDERDVGDRGHGAGLGRGCTGMLRISWGSDHGVDLPGLLRAALAGDRARIRTAGCPKMFQNADSVNRAERECRPCMHRVRLDVRELSH